MHYSFDPSNISSPVNNGSTTWLFHGAAVYERELGGQTWLECWLWGYPDNIGVDSVYVQIYPAIAGTGSGYCICGGVEIYNDALGLSGLYSPETSAAHLLMAGSDPQLYDIRLATKSFTSEQPGTYAYALFPSMPT